ncbi:ribbon-helix-helix domain-containing protein [Kiloniella laminariae]|uniref:Ribbon-helix-helix domain-containing protein n=1 Tax=Kiloniella laminariae TaxID=454162 RepID=A0ABT4LPA5_9PROT|nr:ribbon-helix-helix domain-containing protein [Kiloniella laminariae]MCZ4282967.1 ribbon-helix-helix domain-containing protein [Kiloniella laminariae]
MPRSILPVNFADQAPKARVVQYNKKRYSIRLEPVFWRALEHAAMEHGLKLGKFIGKLELVYQGPNFSSFLRVFCMISSERRLAGADIAPNKSIILSLLDASPSPAALLSEDLTIISCNNAFYNWLGETNIGIEGANITRLFQLRSKGPFLENVKDLQESRLRNLDARIIRMIPGKVITAQARLVKASILNHKKQYMVIWVASTPRMAISRKPIAKRPEEEVSLPEESTAAS